MDAQTTGIDFRCTCGGHFTLANEDIARRGRCPKCGTRIAEVLGIQVPAPPPAVSAPTAERPSASAPAIASPPAAVPPPAAEAKGPRLRLTEDSLKPKPVSLPILEQPAKAEEDIPILLPEEDESEPQPTPAAPSPQPATMTSKISEPPAAKPSPPGAKRSYPPGTRPPATAPSQPPPSSQPVQPAAPASPAAPQSISLRLPEPLRPAPAPVQPAASSAPVAPKPVPAQPAPKSAAPALSERITLQPSAQRQHLSLGKEQPAAAHAPATCEVHGRVVTGHCQNCQKPICMECVQLLGQFCSPTCKEAVAQRTPGRGGKAKIGYSKFDRFRSGLLKAKYPVLLVIVLWVAYWAYANFVAVQPKVTKLLGLESVSLGFGSLSMYDFDDEDSDSGGKTELLGNDDLIYQENQQLRRAKFSTQQQVWTADLKPYEMQFARPHYETNEVMNFEAPPDPRKISSEPRAERPGLVGVNGDYVIAWSHRQLLVFHASDGRLLWRFHKPSYSVSLPLVHENGILCTISSIYSMHPQAPQPRVVNFAFADGKEAWTQASQRAYYGLYGMTMYNGHQVSMRYANPDGSPLMYAPKYKPKPESKPKDGKDAKDKKGPAKPKPKPKIMEDEGDVGELDELSLGKNKGSEMELDETSVPAATYTIEFLSLADGKTKITKTFPGTAGGNLKKLGERMYVIAGAELFWYEKEKGFDPMWKAKLPGFIQDVAHGGDTVAVSTSKGVVALDAKNGQQKWLRSGLPPVDNVHVGHDGVVYVTLELASKDDFPTSEIQDYRAANITTVGRPLPYDGMPAFARLSPKDGRTVWGIQFVGRQVKFSDKEVYVVDTYQPPHILSMLAKEGTDVSLRCINTRNGKDKWRYIYQGLLLRAEVVGNKFLLMSADKDGGDCKLQFVEQKYPVF